MRTFSSFVQIICYGYQKFYSWHLSITISISISIQKFSAGIAHYQFETIHPFLDGNGRIGRLLITLYLSDFFEKHKSLYYDNLTGVRTRNDLTQWLKFFLEGVRQTSENSIQTFRRIIVIRQQCEEKILVLGKKTKNAQAFLRYLYGKPITDAQAVATALGISITTALRLIENFIKLGILNEVTGNRRNRIFVFEEYLRLFS